MYKSVYIAVFFRKLINESICVPDKGKLYLDSADSGKSLLQAVNHAKWI